MKLSAGNRAAFESRIDRSCGPEASIVRRYAGAVRFDDRDERDLAVRRLLPETGIREGARIVALPPYRGVAVDVLDETSLMAAGSLKSVDGCLAAAICRAEGTERVGFESGGNTGSALTLYGRNAGLETFFFCPCDNLDLLDSRLFEGLRAHLVGVSDRRRVKEFAALFAKSAGVRQLPDRALRDGAAMFRGLFILERILADGAVDWISQTISAAFGPIGIYRVLEAFRDDLGGLPRFLGLQQEANCPMFRAWNPEAAERLGPAGSCRGEFLARIMYDESPGTHRTWPALRRLLTASRGDLLTVNGGELDARLRPSRDYGSILEVLGSRGIAIGVRSGQVIEPSGVLALAGTLKAIDAGLIRPGERALCCVSGGAGEADGRARPEFVVREARDVLNYVETVREGR